MSEVTEFLVWRSALADTPTRLATLLAAASDAAEVLARMARSESLAVAVLEHLVAGRCGPPPEPTEPAAGWRDDPLGAFLGLRSQLLELLDRVDRTTLHATTRLASGRPVDPWRLAGDLADHDVRCLAELRAAAESR